MPRPLAVALVLLLASRRLSSSVKYVHSFLQRTLGLENRSYLLDTEPGTRKRHYAFTIAVWGPTLFSTTCKDAPWMADVDANRDANTDHAARKNMTDEELLHRALTIYMRTPGGECPSESLSDVDNLQWPRHPSSFHHARTSARACSTPGTLREHRNT
jgi:hypothetical protein